MNARVALLQIASQQLKQCRNGGGRGCPGIPGRIKSVWVAGYYRYRWPDDPGIRIWSLSFLSICNYSMPEWH